MKISTLILFLSLLSSVAFSQQKSVNNQEVGEAELKLDANQVYKAKTVSNPEGTKKAKKAEALKVTLKFGKGLRISSPDGNINFKFTARTQGLFEGNYNLAGGEDAFDATFMIRRMRLKFGGDALNKMIEYKIELGFSNRDIGVRGRSSDYANIILDAWTRFRLYKTFKVRVGQFKLPGNRERVVSSGDLQMVDRSTINSTFNIDRDAGIMFENSNTIGPVVFRQQASVTLGEGRNRLTKGTGFMYAGRIEILPMGEFESKGDYVMSAIKREKKPKLAIGVNASWNDDASRSGGQLGSTLFDSRDITTVNADFMFKYSGLSVFGEYGWRSTANPVTVNEAADDFVYVYKGQGANIQAGWMFKKNWEVAARYAVLLPDAQINHLTDQRMDYTIGVSKFIVGHNLKVQGDVTYTDRTALSAARSDSQSLQFRLTTNFQF